MSSDLEDTVYAFLENDGNHQIFYDRESRKDGYAIPFVYLKEAIEKLNYKFKPTFDYEAVGNAKDAAYIISFNLLHQRTFQSISKHPKEKCFLCIIEPPVVSEHLYDPMLTNYFGKIFTMLDNYVDNQKYFKFFHPQCCEKKAENVPSFADKKMSVMVQTNHQDGHPKSVFYERRNLATFFINNPDFDMYGRFWDGYPNWKGFLNGSKMDVIKNYKFCFSYENMSDQCGFLTERLAECFYAGCIPIYLGMKNIHDYVPKECFINLLDFKSYNELYDFMKKMTEAEYQKYITAAEEFIKSPKSEPFSTRKFAKTITEHILPRV